MALILCLIIAAILGGYSCYRKVNTVARRQEHIKVAEEYENFCFDGYIATKERTDKVRKASLRDEACYLCGLPADPGNEEERAMRKRIREEAGIQPTFEMVTCAILAQRGLVPNELTKTTYIATIIEPIEENREVEHKFLKWLDNELKQHDMPFRVKFVPRGKHIRYAQSFETDNVSLLSGRYIWHPDQFYGDKFFITREYDYNAPFVDYK